MDARTATTLPTLEIWTPDIFHLVQKLCFTLRASFLAENEWRSGLRMSPPWRGADICWSLPDRPHPFYEATMLGMIFGHRRAASSGQYYPCVLLRSRVIRGVGLARASGASCT